MESDSADPRFTLSKNRTSATWNGKEMPAPGEKTRNSDTWAIWASDGLPAEKNYWEVSVSPETAWSIGVSQQHRAMTRYSRPSPNAGYWSLMLWTIKGSSEHIRPLGPNILLLQLSKLGIFVDVREGRVSFYNLDDGSLVHSFKARFNGKVYPVFKLWISLRPDGSITIL